MKHITQQKLIDAFPKVGELLLRVVILAIVATIGYQVASGEFIDAVIKLVAEIMIHFL